MFLQKGDKIYMGFVHRRQWSFRFLLLSISSCSNLDVTEFWSKVVTIHKYVSNKLQLFEAYWQSLIDFGRNRPNEWFLSLGEKLINMWYGLNGLLGSQNRFCCSSSSPLSSVIGRNPILAQFSLTLWPKELAWKTVTNLYSNIVPNHSANPL